MSDNHPEWVQKAVKAVVLDGRGADVTRATLVTITKVTPRTVEATDEHGHATRFTADPSGLYKVWHGMRTETLLPLNDQRVRDFDARQGRIATAGAVQKLIEQWVDTGDVRARDAAIARLKGQPS